MGCLVELLLELSAMKSVWNNGGNWILIDDLMKDEGCQLDWKYYARFWLFGYRYWALEIKKKIIFGDGIIILGLWGWVEGVLYIYISVLTTGFELLYI